MASTVSIRPTDCFQTHEYRNCQLNIHRSANDFTGFVVYNNAPLFESSAESLDQQIQSLRSWVDAFHQNRQQQRTTLQPEPEEYQQALKAIYPLLSPVQQRLLVKHRRAKHHRCKLDDLLPLNDVPSTIRLLLNYAHIARRLSDELAYIPSLNEPAIDPIVSVLLRPTGLMSPQHQQERFLQLQPEVGHALDSI